MQKREEIYVANCYLLQISALFVPAMSILQNRVNCT